jgi:hypothetical protein
MKAKTIQLHYMIGGMGFHYGGITMDRWYDVSPLSHDENGSKFWSLIDDLERDRLLEDWQFKQMFKLQDDWRDELIVDILK